MKTRILVLASCLLAFASQAQESRKELWTWKDANGVVHFSDTPGPGATRVDLVVHGTSVRRRDGTGFRGGRSGCAAAGRAGHDLQSSRDLAAGERGFVLRRRCDGERAHPHGARAWRRATRCACSSTACAVEGADNSLDYTLENLDRGTHSITATIRDAKGVEKIRSQPVVFYMKQNTIIAPRAVGPNLRPPTRPTPRGG